MKRFSFNVFSAASCKIMHIINLYTAFGRLNLLNVLPHRFDQFIQMPSLLIQCECKEDSVFIGNSNRQIVAYKKEMVAHIVN